MSKKRGHGWRWTRGRPLTRSDLDTAVCGNAGCKNPHNPICFYSRCHRDAPTWSLYDRDGDPGVLQIICSECESLITKIRVAAEA